MAKPDLSGTFLEMESDEISLETTVPTDFDLSGDETSELVEERKTTKRSVSKQLLERKQLIHDIQVLKIELSQKGLMVDNLKADYMQRVEELEENLSDTKHQKQILQARLESQLKIQADDSRRRQDQIQRELDTILKRQHQLETTNERLQEKAGNIKRSLLDLDLTENQYIELKSQSEDDITLRDFVAIKQYEALRPLRIENEDLKSRSRVCNEDAYKLKTELDRYQDLLQEEKRKNEDLLTQNQKLSLGLADTKSQVQHGDFKIENYDRVKRERDDFDLELTDMKKQFAYTEAAHQSAVRERDELTAEISSAKQQIALLKQDKDFFAKQVSDLGNKLLYTEEKVIQLNDQVDRAKQSREELYEKYVASRDIYKGEYESKLRDEMEQIRVRTNTEIDRLKTTTREMYERENRTLREARDMALSERDRALSAEKESNNKHEQLIQDMRSLQMNTDNRMTDMQNEVRLKSFECERTQMVHEETVRTLKDCQLENDKQQKKLEVLTKEYYSLQSILERRVGELEAVLSEKNIKLETYEKLEQELDTVVMQAADVENEEEAEKVLFSYGYGANVPTTAKRRLKQSVNLARRVLELERTNTTFKKDIDKEKEKNRDLAEQLKSANTLLDQSQQPYHYLVESIRIRDEQINKMKAHIATLEKDLSFLEKDRSKLTKNKNQMAADLERLLNQKEEMSVMKQVVLNLSQRRYGQESARSAKSTARTPRTPRSKSAPSKPKRGTQLAPNMSEPEEMHENIHKPEPTQFTSVNKPHWYKKVQQGQIRH